MEAVQNQLQTIPFDKPEFGALVLLPDKVKAWKAETDILRSAADTFKMQLASTDFTASSIEQLDAFDTRLNGAIVKITGTFTRIEADRKAGTSILDEVKSFSMMPEKAIVALPAELKAYRDNIAREKARRLKMAEEAKQREIEKKNEAVEIKAYQIITINKNYAIQVAGMVKAMNDKFNSQTIETFPAYENVLKKFVPNLTDAIWDSMIRNGGYTVLHWTNDEVDAMLKEVCDNERMKVSGEWVAKLIEERDRLIEIIPSRISELEAIKEDASKAQAAAERMYQEQAEREAQLEQEAKDKEDAVAATVQVEQMNNVFDAEAATPVINQAKGTQIKKKYSFNSSSAFLPIIQSWIKNELPLMSIDDLAKKLSFMVTACNDRLNKGEKLIGKDLDFIDDYSTRSTKK